MNESHEIRRFSFVGTFYLDNRTAGSAYHSRPKRWKLLLARNRNWRRLYFDVPLRYSRLDGKDVFLPVVAADTDQKVIRAIYLLTPLLEKRHILRIVLRAFFFFQKFPGCEDYRRDSKDAKRNGGDSILVRER